MLKTTAKALFSVLRIRIRVRIILPDPDTVILRIPILNLHIAHLESFKTKKRKNKSAKLYNMGKMLLVKFILKNSNSPLNC